MTSFLLIRHASADHVGRRLAGRTTGVHLDEPGRLQAVALARGLRDVTLAAVYSSPLERTMETASPIAAEHGLDTVVSEAFHEVDFGEWTGRSFDDLEGDARWTEWNRFRSTARVPGGESMQEVLTRALQGLREIAMVAPESTVAVISHCDVIRSLLAHFAGMPLDHLLRLEVDTASISQVDLHSWGPRILCVNARANGVWRPAGG